MDCRELIDEELSAICGGSSTNEPFWLSYGQGSGYELPKLNIATQLQIGVAPQTVVSLWSKNGDVQGPNLSQINFAFQS
jgi:hypothetical protein